MKKIQFIILRLGLTKSLSVINIFISDNHFAKIQIDEKKKYLYPGTHAYNNRQ